MNSPNGLPFSDAEKARARSRAYGLLSHLFLSGVTEENLAQVRAIADLATFLPEPFQTDEAAADHQHLFGFNVFPYESIFLDASGLLGGEVTDGVIHIYRAAGYSGWEAGESPDHIGHELGLLAFLSAAEGEAWEDALPAVARRMAGLQADFLEGHLLRWLPPLVLAIRAQGQPFYTTLANLTLDLVADHWTQVKANSDPVFHLPSPPDLLGNDKTGLKEIAATLLTPVYSGLYLSRDDIGRLARQRRLPRGFGGRQQMLLNLMRSAVNYEGLDEMLTAIREMARQWRDAYHPISFANKWAERAGHTITLIESMSSRLSLAHLDEAQSNADH